MTRADAKRIWLKDKLLNVTLTRKADGVTEATVDIGQREMTPEIHEAVLDAITRMMYEPFEGHLRICIDSTSVAI